MAFIPLLDGAKATINGRWDGQECVNDLYFHKASGSITLAEITALADLLDVWYSTNMLPLLAASYTYLFTRVRSLNLPNGFEAENGNSTAPGGVGSESAPNNVDPCISFRTGIAGRSFRGRNYIPGIPNTQVNGNTLDPDWMINVQVAYNQLLPTGTSAPTPFDWVVASFFTAGAARAFGVPTPVTTPFFSDNVVDSQRRRLPGRGR